MPSFTTASLKGKKSDMNSNNGISLRHLGKTDLLVSPIGLGVMEMAGSDGVFGRIFPPITLEEKNAIIKTGLEGGINWFDTAEIYGRGASEQSLATGLKAAGKSDQEVIIATKWFPLFRTAGNIPRTIQKRLRFLEPYTISNYMVHQPFGFSGPEAEMNAMADLVEAGKIRSVGVSNFNAARMRRAQAALAKRGLPLAVNQMHYSLLHREIETNGVLETARELGVTITAYTPIERGLLSGKYHQNPELLNHLPPVRQAMMRRDLERTRPLINVMQEIASRYEATIAQVALNWVINFNGEIVVTIPGATKARQAEEAAGAMKFQLSKSELAQLDEVSRKM
jgi:aryl-alcohol dehydrogenase-like predicted oxidoreductase